MSRRADADAGTDAAPPDTNDAAPAGTGAGEAAAPDPAAGTGEASGPAPGPPAGSGERPAPGRRRAGLVAAGLTAVVVTPLVVALVALRSPRWYPLLDLAMTELRVRDVGTADSPLVGLIGRLSSDGDQGSHLGPLSFWLLAPGHRALGGSAWSLMVGVVVLNAAAVGLTLWIAVRRGGTAVALGFAAALAALAHLYGTQVLTEPWNPFMPVMWWPLLLVAVWSVLDDDLAMLPVAALAGSFCLQTHISYAGIVGGLTVLTLAVLVGRALRGGRGTRRRVGGWAAAALALSALLWTPPLIDHLTGDPSNASVVIDHFREAEEDPVGLGRGAELVAIHLDPWRLVIGRAAISGSVVPGAALVTAWLAAALATWRLRRTARTGAAPGARGEPDRLGTLLRLHVVVAAALVLGLVSASRILGFPWYYLLLWGWGTGALTLTAVVWTLAAVARRLGPVADRAVRRAAPAVAGAALAAWVVALAVRASGAEPSQHELSAAVGDLTVPVIEAIEGGEVVPEGRAGTYRVTWTDGTYVGSPGYGLLNELERRGLHVGVNRAEATGAVEHRVLRRSEIDADVHVSVGPDIDAWRQREDAVMIAYADPRTAEDLARLDRARRAAARELTALGRPDLVPLLDSAPFELHVDVSLPADTRAAIAPLTDLGQPVAVFMTTTVG